MKSAISFMRLASCANMFRGASAGDDRTRDLRHGPHDHPAGDLFELSAARRLAPRALAARLRAADSAGHGCLRAEADQPVDTEGMDAGADDGTAYSLV